MVRIRTIASIWNRIGIGIRSEIMVRITGLELKTSISI